jgi:hypothetical protein
MFSEPFYDPERSYLDNFEHGPFGLFAEMTPTSQTSEPKDQFPGQLVFAPFGIPAGPLLSSKFAKTALEKGSDIPDCKVVRMHRRESHLRPNALAATLEGELAPGRTLIANHHYTKPTRDGAHECVLESYVYERNRGASG